MTAAGRVRRRTTATAGALGLVLAAGCATAQARTPAASVVAARDSGELLAPARIARLPEPQRAEWMRYLETSRRLRATDRASVDAELRALGRERMTRAPYGRVAFEVTPEMTASWFAGDSARHVGNVVLSFQTPSGGWSKRVDMRTRPRQPGESYYSESDGWSYIATIDNSATTEQLRFLAGVYAATSDARFRDGFLRGVDYLLAAQFPTGGWPQVYPLQGGYHDAATYNDDAIVNVLRVLRDVADGTHAFVPAGVRTRASAAVALGVEFIVASQVVVGGTRTAWGQQHDPLTGAPVPARSYEPKSLSGKESAAITDFLLRLPAPSPAVVEAAHAAAEWFRAVAINGFHYDATLGLRHADDAPPIWARMYEIGTNRPIFSNRDGVTLYDWNQLTDRREGYAWYGIEPRNVLRRYDRWIRDHPRPTTGARP
jgi:PelA/Pel-15E family pectate lyase